MSNDTEESASTPSLQALMALIGDLQKTIALLTRKLEAYEKRDQDKQAISQDGGNKSTNSSTEIQLSQLNQTSNPQGSAPPFSVNFGSMGLNLNQGQSYASALLSANQSEMSIVVQTISFGLRPNH